MRHVVGVAFPHVAKVARPGAHYRRPMHTAFAARAVALAAGTALALGLSACSDTGGRRALEQQAAAGGHANTPRMTVALITHSGPGDTFWDQVRKGAQDAADKDNVELQYLSLIHI